MTTEHTPGPFFCDEGKGSWFIRTAPDAPAIAQCVLLVFGPTWNQRAYEETQANARLFTAAPDLLAACEAELRVYDGMDMATLMPKTIARIEALRAAVAKAREKE